MKTLSLLLCAVALIGCSKPDPVVDFSGTYVCPNDTLIQKIDLSYGGAAVHSLELVNETDPRIVQILDKAKLRNATWTLENGKIKVTGFSAVNDEPTEVVWYFEIQPNGDLIRHSADGEFDRFKKR